MSVYISDDFSIGLRLTILEAKHINNSEDIVFAQFFVELMNFLATSADIIADNMHEETLVREEQEATRKVIKMMKIDMEASFKKLAEDNDPSLFYYQEAIIFSDELKNFRERALEYKVKINMANFLYSTLSTFLPEFNISFLVRVGGSGR